MKIKVTVSTDKVGSDDYTIIEVADDETEEMIEEQSREAMFNMISWGYEKMEDEEDEE